MYNDKSQHRCLGLRAQALGASLGARDLSCPCTLGVENCSMSYSTHIFECKMTNRCLGRKGSRLGCEGARHVMSLDTGG